MACLGLVLVEKAEKARNIAREAILSKVGWRIFSGENILIHNAFSETLAIAYSLQLFKLIKQSYIEHY